MMFFIEFLVIGNPVAKARARSFVRNGHIGHYTPQKTVDYEKKIKIAGLEAMKKEKLSPFSTPIYLDVVALMKIPKSWSKKKKEQAEKDEIRPTSKPDIDNIVKSVKDGLNGVTWIDDSQVVKVRAEKLYSATPGVWITVGFYHDKQ